MGGRMAWPGGTTSAVKSGVPRPSCYVSGRHAWCGFGIHPETREDGMGRHARLAEREALFEAFEAFEDQNSEGRNAEDQSAEDENFEDKNDEHRGPAGKRRLRWISRVPLLPALAGVGALGIVLAAYGTQQISLNFSDGVGGPPAEAGVPTQRQDAATAQGSRASRGIGRAGAVTVAFRA